MKKPFIIEFITEFDKMSTADYYAESKQEAVKYFRLDFGRCAYIETISEIRDEEYV
jgi:hypothetical protein